MSKVTIYHNPACGTSRNTLALLSENGITPEVIEYLKTPLSREALTDLVAQMDITAKQLLRTKGKVYDALNVDFDKLTNDEALDIMVEYPALMNRPIVVTEKGVRLCRPLDLVKEII
jgi:arsenate reductase